MWGSNEVLSLRTLWAEADFNRCITGKVNDGYRHFTPFKQKKNTAWHV